MAKVDTTDWGTKKRIARVQVTGTFNTTGVQTVDVSAYVPTGTKAVTLYLAGSDNTPGAFSAIEETGGGTAYIVNTYQVAAINNRVTGDVQLTNGTFDLENSEALTSLSIYILAVYL